MAIISDVDLLRDVERSRVPVRVAQRDKLVSLREQALDLVRERGLVRPRACWRIVALECEADAGGVLCLDGQRLHAPRLIPDSGRLTALACAAATIGPLLEQQVGALFAQRSASLALALDAVGNELLFALSRRVQDQVFAAARRQGLTVAGELRAGDPGLDLLAQQTVLDLAGAAQIGLTLTRTLMIHPAKSTSMVQGVGLALPAQTWSRCDDCRSRERCTLAGQAV
jgi:hypothetical protein